MQSNGYQSILSGLLTVIALTAISYLRIQALIKASEWVNHTNLVKKT